MSDNQTLRDILVDLYYKGYHEGKGDIPNMDDIEITAAENKVKELLAEARKGNEGEATAPIEIKAKIEALDKLIMGAGEYHDDPYEYVVRLSDVKKYRSDLAQFDLSQPIFKEPKLYTQAELDQTVAESLHEERKKIYARFSFGAEDVKSYLKATIAVLPGQPPLNTKDKTQ